MATAPSVTRHKAKPVELESGDHMTRSEFHRLYEKTPPKFKAELIEGIVYVPSPLRRSHSTRHVNLGALFATYCLNTPGTEAGDNATILLGKKGEPQPDLYLRILPEYGGQSRNTSDDYVEGPPELVAEVARSRRAIDFHGKLRDYTRYGVHEYLVLSLREQQLRWFDLQAEAELEPDPDGIIRVRTFPGLWIDVATVLHEHPQMTSVLAQGLATPERAAFVRKLAEAASVPRTKRRQASGSRRRSSRKGRSNHGNPKGA